MFPDSYIGKQPRFDANLPVGASARILTEALLSPLPSPKVKYDFLYDHYHVCCQERWHSLPHRQAYTTFIMVALFLLPLATMLFLYTRIGIELWIRKRVGDSSVLDTMNHREIGKISR